MSKRGTLFHLTNIVNITVLTKSQFATKSNRLQETKLELKLVDAGLKRAKILNIL